MKHFHAHLYYNQDSLRTAKDIIEKISELDCVEIGRMHEKPVGPHPMWSCQILFKTEQLQIVLPWLIINRKELKVFIHPVTGNDLEDHTIHTMWLGEAIDLNLSIFS